MRKLVLVAGIVAAILTGCDYSDESATPAPSEVSTPIIGDAQVIPGPARVEPTPTSLVGDAGVLPVGGFYGSQVPLIGDAIEGAR